MNTALARLQARIRAAERRDDARQLAQLRAALAFLQRRLLWQKGTR